MRPLLRKRLRLRRTLRLCAVQIIEPLCQRREKLISGNAPGFNESNELIGRDVETGRHSIQRAWQAFAKLPTQLLKLHDALARHLRQRLQRALGVVGRFASN